MVFSFHLYTVDYSNHDIQLTSLSNPQVQFEAPIILYISCNSEQTSHNPPMNINPRLRGSK